MNGIYIYSWEFDYLVREKYYVYKDELNNHIFNLTDDEQSYFVRIIEGASIGDFPKMGHLYGTREELNMLVKVWEKCGEVRGLMPSAILNEEIEKIGNNYFIKTNYDVIRKISEDEVYTSSNSFIEENNTVKDIEKQKTAGTTNSKPEKPKSEFWGNFRLTVFLSVFLGGLVLFYTVVGNPDSFPSISKLILYIFAIVALFFVCSFLGVLVSEYLIHDNNESIFTNFIRGLIVLALIFLFGWLSFDFSDMFDSRGAP